MVLTARSRGTCLSADSPVARNRSNEPPLVPAARAPCGQPPRGRAPVRTGSTRIGSGCPLSRRLLSRCPPTSARHPVLREGEVRTLRSLPTTVFGTLRDARAEVGTQRDRAASANMLLITLSMAMSSHRRRSARASRTTPRRPAMQRSPANPAPGCVVLRCPHQPIQSVSRRRCVGMLQLTPS